MGNKIAHLSNESSFRLFLFYFPCVFFVTYDLLYTPLTSQYALFRHRKVHCFENVLTSSVFYPTQQRIFLEYLLHAQALFSIGKENIINNFFIYSIILDFLHILVHIFLLIYPLILLHVEMLLYE
jgi:hypothetical protein